ncbi:MAG: HAD-IC family P-type ATPase [Cellulomonadaceae bacterium]|jgi:cation transport ATPase|nr:HAD-IC family P-type ATPase [Cellulomonadaceae bacterium]
MTSWAELPKKYPLVATTLAVAILGGILSAVAPAAVPWVVGGYCALMALRALISMIKELLGGSLGLDVLAVTAIVATIAVGEFWASLVIVLMVTSGEALEDYAGNRAKRDLTSLVSNAPRVAHVLQGQGGVPGGSVPGDVDVADVPVGARILVKAHEVVPLDSILVSSVGVFDDSSLTGESMPVERAAGDEVLSGSINGAVAVEMDVKRASADSQYQQIVSLVESAAASRSPMVRMADRYAVPFTLISFAIAGFAWWHSGDPYRFAQVLVVATPCPLLIATPVAFMAGTSRAARRGMIVRSSATLEKLSKARSFAFDKTGTVTSGSPGLVNVHGETVSADTLLRLAASVEQGSAHVLAASLVRGATERGLTLSSASDVQETTAGGVSAHVDGSWVVVGKASYVAAALEAGDPDAAAGAVAGAVAGVTGTGGAGAAGAGGVVGAGMGGAVGGGYPVGAAGYAVEETQGGGSESTSQGVGHGGVQEIVTPALDPGEVAVYVGVDGEYAGYAVLRDMVRSDAAATMHSLMEQGIETVAMFTGDEEATAQHIASELGINEVHAGCLPADKVAGVAAMPHRPVVMVGDGVNDAPVLAAADVGIAMAARGSTAASESADVVILPDTLHRVAETLAIGKHTVRVAKQSIYLGIGLSIALMLFATSGVMPALVGAWVQEAVDVVAIVWALKASTGKLPGPNSARNS